MVTLLQNLFVSFRFVVDLRTHQIGSSQECLSLRRIYLQQFAKLILVLWTWITDPVSWEYWTLCTSEATGLLQSPDGSSEPNSVVEHLARDYEALSLQSESPKATKGTDTPEDAVRRLALQCKDEAHRLLEVLDDLKVPQSRRGIARLCQTARQAARSVKKREAIAAKRRYLHELNGQFVSAFLEVISSNQASYAQQILHRIDRASADGASLLAQTRTAIALAMSVQSSHQQLLGLPQGSPLNGVRFDIINTLRIPDMQLRREAIPEAYERTFDWVFELRDPDLTAWLSGGCGVFWITGKAASGKSTLMKYIYHHEETQKLLASWAPKELRVDAEFYFWFPGTFMQKSIQGLLQSILHQILGACPDLVDLAVPQRLQDAQISGRHLSEPWTASELSCALHSIAKDTRLTKRFCLFIDGLDEFHEDHQVLVEIVQKLATHPRIKLCVSSRPWNVFARAFEKTIPWLRLEDLTHEDIQWYVSGELAIIRELPDADDLVTEVVGKAQGVFLWVHLVVRSLKQGHIEGDTITFMRERVRHFPADLEDYFRLIISRVDPVYKKKTAQVLSLAALYPETESPIQATVAREGNFLQYWRIMHGIESSSFAVEADIEVCKPLDLVERANETRRFLSAASKDLLHVPGHKRLLQERVPSVFNLERTSVEFLHRTVYDFLQTQDMQKLLREHTPAHFYTPWFLGHLALARMKLVLASDDPAALGNQYDLVAKAQRESNPGDPLYEEL